MPTFRKPYGPPVKVQLASGQPSRAMQSFKDECDINNILRRYQKTGLISHVQRFQGKYSDLSSVPDYHQAMQIVLDANEAFDSLPSTVRKACNNDPVQFLQLVSDPEKRDQAVALGLMKKAEPDPAAAPPQTDPDPAPAGE